MRAAQRRRLYLFLQCIFAAFICVAVALNFHILSGASSLSASPSTSAPTLSSSGSSEFALPPSTSRLTSKSLASVGPRDETDSISRGLSLDAGVSGGSRSPAGNQARTDSISPQILPSPLPDVIRPAEAQPQSPPPLAPPSPVVAFTGDNHSDAAAVRTLVRRRVRRTIVKSDEVKDIPSSSAMPAVMPPLVASTSVDVSSLTAFINSGGHLPILLITRTRTDVLRNTLSSLLSVRGVTRECIFVMQDGNSGRPLFPRFPIHCNQPAQLRLFAVRYNLCNWSSFCFATRGQALR